MVADPGAVVRAGDPVAADPSSTPNPAALITTPPGAEASGVTTVGRLAGLTGGGWPLEPGAAGLGTLVVISAVSLVVSLLRRHYQRRRLTARIAARLADLRGPVDRPGGVDTG